MHDLPRPLSVVVVVDLLCHIGESLWHLLVCKSSLGYFPASLDR